MVAVVRLGIAFKSDDPLTRLGWRTRILTALMDVAVSNTMKSPQYASRVPGYPTILVHRELGSSVFQVDRSSAVGAGRVHAVLALTATWRTGGAMGGFFLKY